jgi:hypothetical protein
MLSNQLYDVLIYKNVRNIDELIDDYGKNLDYECKDMLLIYFYNSYINKTISGSYVKFPQIPNLPKTLSVHDCKYKLVSCVMNFTDDESNIGHAICGYICNDVPYLYDSNNYISNDNWLHLNVTKYFNYCKSKYGLNVTTIVLNFVIYVKI